MSGRLERVRSNTAGDILGKTLREGIDGVGVRKGQGRRVGTQEPLRKRAQWAHDPNPP